MAMAQAKRDKRPYHHGSLHAAAVEAGRGMLDERSEDELSLREIARQVGVSATAVYRHFPDKAALLEAIAAEGLQLLARAQRAANTKAGGGRAGFLAMGEAYVEFAVKNPALFRLIYAHPPKVDPMDPEWGGVSAAMALLLDASPELAPQGVAPRAFALHSWALVHGLAMLVLDGQVANDAQRIREALTAYQLAPRAD